MKTSISRIDEARLDQALADIRHYIQEPKKWQAAMKQLSAIRDYSFGEVRFCSAQQALENCRQIQAVFPGSTPPSVTANLDAIAETIQRIEKHEAPIFLELIMNPLVVITVGVIVVIYFMYFR